MGVNWNREELALWLEQQGQTEAAQQVRESAPSSIFNGGGGLTGTTPNNELTMLILGLVALKVAKMPGGLKMIQALGKEFLRGIFDTLDALGRASAGNRIAAWANPLLVSAVLDRFGFVKPEFIKNYHLGITVIAGGELTQDFISTIAGAMPWNLFKQPDASKDFPTHLMLGSRGVSLMGSPDE